MNRVAIGGAVACAMSVFFATSFDSAAASGPRGMCPVPVDYRVSSGKANSPEKPKPLFAVCHNGKRLCLPKSAADAHVAHGDTLLGSCTKPGNTGVSCTPSPTPKPKKK